MTKVRIHPGVCGLTTVAEAAASGRSGVEVTVCSDCESVRKMVEALGSSFDAYEVCLARPGANVFYQYAEEHFPVHAGCPVIAGIVKCMEAECRLALPRGVSIVCET